MKTVPKALCVLLLQQIIVPGISMAAWDSLSSFRGYDGKHFARYLAMGDLNGDGSLDIAVGNDGVYSSVLLNKGDGTFYQKGRFTTEGTYVTSFATCDYDHDGDLDLAATFDEDIGLGIFFNDGEGSFEFGVYMQVGLYPTQVVSRDLNGDGWLDLVVANDLSHNVSIWILAPEGRNHTWYETARYPSRVSVSDFDGDGDPDVVALTDLGQITVLLNNGDGIFGNRADYPASFDFPKWITASDLDGDGDSDIAIANTGYDSISLLFNDGQAAFGGRTDYGTGAGPRMVVPGDVDGDGDQDLVVTNEHNHSFSVFANNGSGNFSARTDLETPWFPYSLAVVDMDNDAHLDVVIGQDYLSTHTVSVFRNKGDGAFPQRSYYDVAPEPSCVQLTDFDQDGLQDIAITSRIGEVVSVLLNNGGRSFTLPTSYSTGQSPTIGVSSDLDLDGFPDLIVSNSGSNSVSVLLNLGGGLFAQGIEYTTGPVPYSVAAADLDGDDYPDLAVANQGLGVNTVSILRNFGNGTFSAPNDFAAGVRPSAVVAKDLNGDLDVDLAVASSLGGAVSILLNDGNAVFQPPVTHPLKPGLTTIVAYDLDRDGDFDLAVSNPLEDMVSILLNNGDGTFEAGENYSSCWGSTGLAAFDMDGDLVNELVATCDGIDPYWDEAIAILHNEGNGSFLQRTDYGTGEGPVSVAVGDLDLDGRPDVVTADERDDTVSILWGTGPMIEATVTLDQTTFLTKSKITLEASFTNRSLRILGDDENLEGRLRLRLYNAGLGGNYSSLLPTLPTLAPGESFSSGILTVQVPKTSYPRLQAILDSPLRVEAFGRIDSVADKSGAGFAPFKIAQRGASDDYLVNQSDENADSDFSDGNMGTGGGNEGFVYLHSPNLSTDLIATALVMPPNPGSAAQVSSFEYSATNYTGETSQSRPNVGLYRNGVDGKPDLTQPIVEDSQANPVLFTGIGGDHLNILEVSAPAPVTPSEILWAVFRYGATRHDRLGMDNPYDNPSGAGHVNYGRTWKSTDGGATWEPILGNWIVKLRINAGDGN